MHTFIKILSFILLVFGPMSLAATSSDNLEPPVELEIYPNPTIDWLQIDVCDDDLFAFHYQIVSITGHVMKYGQITSEENVILVDDLNKGQYILKLVAQDFYTAKVIQISN